MKARRTENKPAALRKRMESAPRSIQMCTDHNGEKLSTPEQRLSSQNWGCLRLVKRFNSLKTGIVADLSAKDKDTDKNGVFDRPHSCAESPP